MSTLKVAVLLLALLSTPAAADVAGRYENTAENQFIDMEMTIEVDDAGNVRVQMAGQPNYYLLKGGELFVVGRGTEGAVAMRASDMLQVQAEALQRMGVADRFAEETPDIPRLELVEIGPEIVGGRNGKAYGFANEDGQTPARAVMVLSDDPRLAPLGQAMVAMQANMVRGMGQFTAVLGQLGREYEAIMSKGTPLRMAQLELTDVSFGTISLERFDLPASLLSLEELRSQSEPFPAPSSLPPRAD